MADYIILGSQSIQWQPITAKIDKTDDFNFTVTYENWKDSYQAEIMLVSLEGEDITTGYVVGNSNPYSVTFDNTLDGGTYKLEARVKKNDKTTVLSTLEIEVEGFAINVVAGTAQNIYYFENDLLSDTIERILAGALSETYTDQVLGLVLTDSTGESIVATGTAYYTASLGDKEGTISVTVNPSGNIAYDGSETKVFVYAYDGRVPKEAEILNAIDGQDANFSIFAYPEVDVDYTGGDELDGWLGNIDTDSVPEGFTPKVKVVDEEGNDVSDKFDIIEEPEESGQFGIIPKYDEDLDQGDYKIQFGIENDDDDQFILLDEEDISIAKSSDVRIIPISGTAMLIQNAQTTDTLSIDGSEYSEYTFGAFAVRGGNIVDELTLSATEDTLTINGKDNTNYGYTGEEMLNEYEVNNYDLYVYAYSNGSVVNDDLETLIDGSSKGLVYTYPEITATISGSDDEYKVVFSKLYGLTPVVELLDNLSSVVEENVDIYMYGELPGKPFLSGRTADITLSNLLDEGSYTIQAGVEKK